MNTIFSLMAEFETGEIPLRNVCEKYLGVDFKTAAYRANKNKLPFPVYRGGSQKSTWLISASTLAGYIDTKKQEAQIEWDRVNAV